MVRVRNARPALAVIAALALLGAGCTDVGLKQKIREISSPKSPLSLGATAIDAASISLTWAAGESDVSSYHIERSLASGSGFSEIAIVEGFRSAGYTDEGLAGSTTYYYRLRAYNDVGPSAYSNVASATTALAPPLAPSGLAATMVSFNTISLQWVDNSANEESFVIERGLDAAGPFTALPGGTVGAGYNTYSDSSCPAATTTYYYRVLAHNSAGDSPPSGVAYATTDSPPLVPFNLSAHALDSTRVRLSWELPAVNSFTSLRVQRKLSGGSYADVKSLTTSELTWDDPGTGIVAGNEYVYSVYAVVASGNTPASNEATVAVMAAPSISSARASGSTAIEVQVATVSSPPAGMKLTIQRRDLPSGSFADLASDLDPALVGSYSDAGALAEHQYEYRARYYRNSDLSSFSAASDTVQTLNAPTSFSISGSSSTSIALVWTDASSAETGYEVYRSADGSTWPATAMATTGANSASYSDLSVTANTSYYYRIRAICGTGSSDFAGPLLGMALSAPTGVTIVSNDSGHVNMTWSYSGSGQNGFSIERSAASDYSGSTVAATAVAADRSAAIPATPGTAYYYRIRATSSGGSFSTWAAPTTNMPITPLAPPTGLSITAAHTSSADLVWTPAATPGFYLRFQRSSDGGATWSSYIEITNTAASYTDNGSLSGGTPYSYRLYYQDSMSTSDYATASVTTARSLTLYADGTKGSIAGATLIFEVPDGSSQAIAAIPNSGWYFTGWSAVTGASFANATARSTTVTLTQSPVTVTASFDNTATWAAATTTKSFASVGPASLSMDLFEDWPTIGYVDTSTAKAGFSKYSGSWINSSSELSSVNLAAMALKGSMGYPAVAYQNTSADLMYAEWNGSAWGSATTVQLHYSFDYTTYSYGYNPSIVLLGSASIVIANETQSNSMSGSSVSSLITKNNSMGSWSASESLASWVWSYTNMTSAITVSGTNFYVSYFNPADSDLMYIEKTGASWSSAVTVDSGGNVGSASSIAVDTSGKRHIAYYDATNYSIKYAVSSNGTSWTTTTLAGPTAFSATNHGTSPSVAVTSSGYPCIAYYQALNKIVVAVGYPDGSGGTAWRFDTVDAAAGFQNNKGASCVIKVDSTNVAHIAYIDSTITKLQYSKRQKIE